MDDVFPDFGALAERSGNVPLAEATLVRGRGGILAVVVCNIPVEGLLRREDIFAPRLVSVDFGFAELSLFLAVFRELTEGRLAFFIFVFWRYTIFEL